MSNIPVEIAEFANRCESKMKSGLTEEELTAQIRDDLEAVLDKGFDLPTPFTTPNPDHYVMYPLYISDDGDFCVASAVWGVGQRTPVHGHETWGVVGIYSGRETEKQFEKPTGSSSALVETGEVTWRPGEVTVCCTTDDDVHEVWSDGNEPCVGIHVYGANIGELRRRKYDPMTGEESWFVSTWAPIGVGG
ncbi:cysteine dioxygenase family protein [Dietzia aurantiaca]|uniref:Cysteine dioxygenase family protein n=1 Tax=Dietzia aurantiaca TaxID=983873 RepID=A0ABV9PWZ4_9ACTN